MSLMGSLYVGTSGLQTSQNALNTTAHNMVNVDTTGYTRQMVQQSTRPYNTISSSGSAISSQQLGLGVLYAETKAVRDMFLDKAYRKESGRSAFYEVSVDALEEVENLFQELQGEDFATALENLWKSVQDLANDPSGASRQSVFVQRCYEFLTRADAVYQGLCDYQDNMNNSIKNDVDRINEIGRQIKELNEHILQIEIGNMEHANDLRDQRNQLLDELSSLVYITYHDDALGNVNVRIEGNDFVKADSVNEICLYQDSVTGFYTPYWKQLASYYTDVFGREQVDIEGASVFHLDQVISTDANTDIGALKSKLLARGDHRATCEDLQDPVQYDKNISQSILMNMQAEFDNLIHLVAAGINQVLEDAADPASGYLCDSSGKPFQMFKLVSDTGAYTIRNMVINGELRQAPSLLGFMRPGVGEDHDTMTKLKELFTAEEHRLNPNVATKVNLREYYNSMISQVGNSGSVAKAIYYNQGLTVEQIAGAREQVVGVSSEEEMSNMIMFQNAFNASSRYITVVSEMLEHLINALGR